MQMAFEISVIRQSREHHREAGTDVVDPCVGRGGEPLII